MDQGTPLGEFVKGRIYRGIVTGLNEAFVVDQDKRDDLIEDDPRSVELIKPWLRGKDIKRWRVESAGLFVIHVPWSLDISMYPAVEQHVTWFRDKLKNRPEARRGVFPWFAMSRWGAEFHTEFTLPKIVWGNLAVESKFARDTSHAYVSAPANFLIEPVPWLLPLMNSSLLNFLYPKLTVGRGGAFQEFKIAYIEPAPIVTPDSDAQVELERLANEILGFGEFPDQVEAIEREIDTIVFDIYGLASSERKLVLDWLGERREALGAEMPADWRRLNALQASARAWKDSIDGEQLKQNVRASREIRTRPVPRL